MIVMGTIWDKMVTSEVSFEPRSIKTCHKIGWTWAPCIGAGWVWGMINCDPCFMFCTHRYQVSDAGFLKIWELKRAKRGPEAFCRAENQICHQQSSRV